MQFEEQICCYDMYYSGMVNEYWILLFMNYFCTNLVFIYTTIAVQWNIYEQCSRHICSGSYASNVKCMFTSVPGHIIDCSDFI